MASPLPPETAHVGNLRLLDEPLTALFCSRRCPGDLILKTYDLARAMRDAGVPVVGGFQTPMEQECLRLLLRGGQPVVVCPARGVEGMRVPREWRAALDDGRMLALSPFPSAQRRQTAALAARRNEFVAALAARVFIAHAAPRRADGGVRPNAGGRGQAAPHARQPRERQPPRPRRASRGAGASRRTGGLLTRAPVEILFARRWCYHYLARRDGRVDDCGGLENRCAGDGTVGSNPTPSAKRVATGVK